MSGDFCDHPVGRFILTLLKNMNQEKYDLVGIDTGSKEDVVNISIRKICTYWINVAGKHLSKQQEVLLIQK